MGKLAFVFSGQGDQYSGMGKNLFEQYTPAKEVFEMCDDLRLGTSTQCFCGTEEELKETKNTQPCLCAFELAAATVLSHEGIKPDVVAGFSLGEVVACTFAGLVNEETGFRLVCKRGELMQQASEKQDTFMAAVVKLTQEQVEELCKECQDVYAVNYNCPGQITIAGLSSQKDVFFTLVKEAGGRAIPLKVSGAFHSPFMKEAADSFYHELNKVDLQKSHVVVYSNVTAQPYTNDDEKMLLSKQICNPVRWENTIRNMIASGVDTFVEIGPGKTLTNIIGKIDTNIKSYSVNDLSAVLSEVRSC